MLDKQRVLAALTRLNEAHTRGSSWEELSRLVTALDAYSISTFLSCLHATNAQFTLPCRTGAVRLYGVVAERHPDLLKANAQRIVESTVARARDRDGGRELREACAEALGLLVAHERAAVAHALRGVLPMLAEPSEISQLGGLACIIGLLSHAGSRLSDAAAAKIAVALLRLLGHCCASSHAPALEAAAALLERCAAAASVHAPSFVNPCIRGAESDEWAARRAAAMLLQSLATHQQPSALAQARRLVPAVQMLRHDKHRAVREAAALAAAALSGLSSGGGDLPAGANLPRERATSVHLRERIRQDRLAARKRMGAKGVDCDEVSVVSSEGGKTAASAPPRVCSTATTEPRGAAGAADSIGRPRSAYSTSQSAMAGGHYRGHSGGKAAGSGYWVVEPLPPGAAKSHQLDTIQSLAEAAADESDGQEEPREEGHGCATRGGHAGRNSSSMAAILDASGGMSGAELRASLRWVRSRLDRKLGESMMAWASDGGADENDATADEVASDATVEGGEELDEEDVEEAGAGFEEQIRRLEDSQERGEPPLALHPHHDPATAGAISHAQSAARLDHGATSQELGRLRDELAEALRDGLALEARSKAAEAALHAVEEARAAQAAAAELAHQEAADATARAEEAEAGREAALEAADGALATATAAAREAEEAAAARVAAAATATASNAELFAALERAEAAEAAEFETAALLADEREETARLASALALSEARCGAAEAAMAQTSQADTEREAVLADLEAARAELESAETALESARTEGIASATAAATREGTLQSELEALRGSLAQAEALAAARHDEMVSLEARVESASAEVESARAANAECEERATAASKALGTARAAEEAAREAAATARRELESLEADRARFAADAVKLRDTAAELSCRAESAESRAEAAESRADAAESRAEAAENAHLAAEAEAEGQRGHVVRLEKEVAAAAETAASEVAASRAAQCKADEATAQLAVLQAKADSLAAKADSLAADAAVARKERDSHAAEAGRAATASEEVRATCARAEGRVADLEAAVSTLEGEVAALEARQHGLGSQLEMAGELARVEEEKRRVAEEELELLRARVAHEEEKRARAEAERLAKEAELAAVRARPASGKSRVEKAAIVPQQFRPSGLGAAPAPARGPTAPPRRAVSAQPGARKR